MPRPLFGRRKAEPADSQEPEYWLSYSDLMAGLLMAFALMLLAALYHEGQQDCKLNAYEATSASIGRLLEDRQSVVDSLWKQFDSDDGVQVDSGGTVRFAGSLLFDQGSAVISPQGRDELASFARTYFPLLLDNEDFQSHLRRIVVEGHTNDDGGYKLNLRLSHSRSLAVMEVLLEEAGSYRDRLQQLVTANGRSFADLVHLPSGQVDKVGSRRIEIRFRLDDEALAGSVMALDALEPDCEP